MMIRGARVLRTPNLSCGGCFCGGHFAERLTDGVRVRACSPRENDTTTSYLLYCMVILYIL